MYLPEPFREKDEAFIASFVDAHPLATVVISSSTGPIVDHLPFMRCGELAAGSMLIAHAAKSNSVWKSLDANVPAILIFSGAGAYVSPSLYPSKARTHEVVPTWNYVAVHVHGRLHCSDELAEKRRIVDLLTAKMEVDRSVPWKTTDAPSAYIEKMLLGIVGLNFQIESIIAKTKASQNRTAEDRGGVVAGLATASASLEAALVAEELLKGRSRS
jgi:transcriptional regulator